MQEDRWKRREEGVQEHRRWSEGKSRGEKNLKENYKQIHRVGKEKKNYKGSRAGQGWALGDLRARLQ